MAPVCRLNRSGCWRGVASSLSWRWQVSADMLGSWQAQTHSVTPTDTHTRTRTPLNDTRIQVNALRLQLQQTYFTIVAQEASVSTANKANRRYRNKHGESDPLWFFNFRLYFIEDAPKICLTLSSSPSDCRNSLVKIKSSLRFTKYKYKRSWHLPQQANVCFCNWTSALSRFY